MTVYFTASITGKKQYEKNYRAIVSYLLSKHYTVIADHILKESESNIRGYTRQQRLAFHEQLEKWIRSADFMVAETSFPSISVGYEISLALHLAKPVLILYNEGDPPSLLAYHQSERLVCENYTTETLQDTIDQFIRYIQGKNDMRFTFFITPEIASFLDSVSKKEKLPKSVYLRKLIEKNMQSSHH